MSYSRLGLSGLGDVATTAACPPLQFGTGPVLPCNRIPTQYVPVTTTAMPEWDSVATQRLTWGSPGATQLVEFGTIEDNGVLDAMMIRLANVWAQDPSEIDIGPDAVNKPGRRTLTARRTINDWAGYEQFHIRDDGPFVAALWIYWCRVNHDVAHWPAGYNFGPSTGGGVSLHISKMLYNQLRNGEVWWNPGASGYTHQLFHGKDWLLRGLIAPNLVRMGYLTADANLSGTWGGPLSLALATYCGEMLALPEALLYQAWPHYATGPVKGLPWAFAQGDQDQFAIQMDAVKTLVAGVSARSVQRRSAQAAVGATALASATIRPPIIGMPADMGWRPVLPGGALQIAPTFKLKSAVRLPASATLIRAVLKGVS